MTADDPGDDERYPTLTPEGEAMLRFLREHPSAPIFRNQSGNRLTTEDVKRVLEHERRVLDGAFEWAPSEPPPWLDAFVDRCFATVPHWQRSGPKPALFADLPTSSRADLSHDIAAFVPDDAPVERLINFRTSGTTGHPLLLASHPVVAASYLAYHKRALRGAGVELRHGRGDVGVVLLGFQRECFTYVSVTPTMGESGLAKINLFPGDWRSSGDRVKYLEALAPEVLAGDPISFAELLRLEPDLAPRAILSTSMALTDGLRRRLAERFLCPVLDLYSLNEAGPVASAVGGSGGHVLLQPETYVEILDAEGRPVPEGERGEVTLTGGFNFCLPLLRYRTGDQASLERAGGELRLVGLQGRPPVRFRTAGGQWLNNIEITHALRRFAIVQYTVHQDAAFTVRCRYAGSAHDREAIHDALRALLGASPTLDVEPVDSFPGQVVQYTSDLPDDFS